MITKLENHVRRYMYLAVGEIGSVADLRVIATRDELTYDACLLCALHDIVGCERMFGSCMAESRPDKTSVIYKKIEEDE